MDHPTTNGANHSPSLTDNKSKLPTKEPKTPNSTTENVSKLEAALSAATANLSAEDKKKFMSELMSNPTTANMSDDQLIELFNGISTANQQAEKFRKQQQEQAAQLQAQLQAVQLAEVQKQLEAAQAAVLLRQVNETSNTSSKNSVKDQPLSLEAQLQLALSGALTKSSLQNIGQVSQSTTKIKDSALTSTNATNTTKCSSSSNNSNSSVQIANNIKKEKQYQDLSTNIRDILSATTKSQQQSTVISENGNSKASNTNGLTLKSLDLAGKDLSQEDLTLMLKNLEVLVNADLDSNLHIKNPLFLYRQEVVAFLENQVQRVQENETKKVQSENGPKAKTDSIDLEQLALLQAQAQLEAAQKEKEQLDMIRASQTQKLNEIRLPSAPVVANDKNSNTTTPPKLSKEEMQLKALKSLGLNISSLQDITQLVQFAQINGSDLSTLTGIPNFDQILVLAMQSPESILKKAENTNKESEQQLHLTTQLKNHLSNNNNNTQSNIIPNPTTPNAQNNKKNRKSREERELERKQREMEKIAAKEKARAEKEEKRRLERELKEKEKQEARQLKEKEKEQREKEKLREKEEKEKERIRLKEEREKEKEKEKEAKEKERQEEKERKEKEKAEQKEKEAKDKEIMKRRQKREASKMGGEDDDFDIKNPSGRKRQKREIVKSTTKTISIVTPNNDPETSDAEPKEPEKSPEELAKEAKIKRLNDYQEILSQGFGLYNIDYFSRILSNSLFLYQFFSNAKYDLMQNFYLLR